MAKYTIGVDYGSLSGRAVLLNLENGREEASSVHDYTHAVMDEKLPSGRPLPLDFALQHPQDYLDVLQLTIPDVLKKAGVAASDVIGIATDFTACTVLPVKHSGTPLCFLPQYADEPHAYVKLWKHHAAQDKANQLNAIAKAREEDWLARYGGKISSEWAFPKYWEVLAEAPEIYAAADLFVEAADWIIWQLCGQLRRNACTAGYKAMWHKQKGYPSPAFCRALDPRMGNIVADKLAGEVYSLGLRAGTLTPQASALTGLPAGIAVAVGNVDAHVSVPAAGIDRPGKMLAIIGTSTCHMVVGEKESVVPGMCGVVEDGILPGFFGYEAGQSCVGDHFDWLVKRCVPEDYQLQARAAGESIFALLSRKAAALKAGESGLLALDWFNGNRSVLVDVDLTGLFIGLTLQTRPEEIYRALVEATAFGTRKIIETFRGNGVPVNEFYAAGGIARKDSLVMQIYADVLAMPVKICGSDQAPALGSAIFAAVAAGAENGGFDDIFTAARKIGKVSDRVYSPNRENTKIYDLLYAQYSQLHDYFGRGGNDVMKRLKSIKNEIRDARANV